MKDYLILNQKIKLPTIIAISEDEKSRGLMHVPFPPPIMSFPFSDALPRKFWMKNTPSPLDVLFCRAGKIIAVEKGEPCSEKHFGPNEESDLVIELPFGLAAKLGLQKNQEVRLCWSIDSLAKKFAYNLKFSLIKNARIDLKSEYSNQIKKIESLIFNFIKNSKIKDKKEYSLGIVEFSFNGEIAPLEIIVTSDDDLNIKGGFQKAVSKNENDCLLINLSAFKADKLYFELSEIIHHEVTHFIDFLYNPEQNLMFSEQEFNSDTREFSKFYSDFLNLYNKYLKRFKLKNKETKFSSFEDEIKYFVFKVIKTNEFRILLSVHEIQLNSIVIGKLIKYIENVYVEDITFQEGNVFNLFSTVSDKEKEQIKKDYTNSKTELKAHLNQIIEEIENNLYKFVDVVEMFTRFDLEKLLSISKTFSVAKKYLYPENLQWMEKEIAIYFKNKFSKNSMKEQGSHFGITLSEHDEFIVRYLRFLMHNNKNKFREKISDPKFVVENKNAIEYLTKQSQMFSELAEINQSMPA